MLVCIDIWCFIYTFSNICWNLLASGVRNALQSVESGQISSHTTLLSMLCYLYNTSEQRRNAFPCLASYIWCKDERYVFEIRQGFEHCLVHLRSCHNKQLLYTTWTIINNWHLHAIHMVSTTYTVCCNCTLNPTKFISLQVFFKLQILSLTCWIHHKSSSTRVWCSFVQNNMLFRFMVYWHRTDLTFVGSSLSAALSLSAATCIGTTLTIFCSAVCLAIAFALDTQHSGCLTTSTPTI